MFTHDWAYMQEGRIRSHDEIVYGSAMLLYICCARWCSSHHLHAAVWCLSSKARQALLAKVWDHPLRVVHCLKKKRNICMEEGQPCHLGAPPLHLDLSLCRVAKEPPRTLSLFALSLLVKCTAKAGHTHLTLFAIISCSIEERHGLFQSFSSLLGVSSSSRGPLMLSLSFPYSSKQAAQGGAASINVHHHELLKEGTALLSPSRHLLHMAPSKHPKEGAALLIGVPYYEASQEGGPLRALPTSPPHH